jgi:hypothetical protein
MELNRFKQLLESTMGNVRPLISEQTTERPCVSAVKEIANATSMKLYPEGIAAILGDVKKGINVGCTSSGDDKIGFSIDTDNDTTEADILNKIGDVSFLGKTGWEGPAKWDSVPNTPDNIKKIINIINVVKPILGF